MQWRAVTSVKQWGTIVRDAVQQNPGMWLAIGGFLIGALFGATVYRTNFCTMGSISDILNLSDWRRFRAWVLAAVVAIVGTQAIAWAGIVPLEKSMYLAPSLNWAGNILGGLLFGYGMVFGGGCASRNLARAGGGDLRALMTLIIMGLVAYMAIGGILGPLRASLEQATAVSLAGIGAKTQGLGDVLGAVLKQPAQRLGAGVTALIALASVTFCFKDAEFRKSSVHVASGLGVGLCAVLGWALTGLAFDELADRPMTPISLTYVRPTADSIEWLQRFTAARMPGFGVTTVFGALFGAFLAAKMMGRFKLLTFSDLGDTKRALYGATLMGIGGVMALGCTIGQGVTGVSTLAIGSFLTFGAICAGAVFGLKRLEAAIMREA